MGTLKVGDRSLDKAFVVNRIRELTESNGGQVSFRCFVHETGIPGQRLRRQEWFQGWNALLEELGINTSSFLKSRIPDASVAAAVARLIERIGRWPTEDEFVREKKVDPSFPSVSIIRRLKKEGKLLNLLQNYCDGDASLAAVERVVAEQSAVQSGSEPSTENNIAQLDRIQGYVYMLRYGRKYKIGYTVTPVRRFRDVRIELPGETTQVHAIATDDPKGIEDYWHRRFSAKRIRKTEWFELNADDVRVFKRRTYQ